MGACNCFKRTSACINFTTTSCHNSGQDFKGTIRCFKLASLLIKKCSILQLLCSLPVMNHRKRKWSRKAQRCSLSLVMAVITTSGHTASKYESYVHCMWLSTHTASKYESYIHCMWLSTHTASKYESYVHCMWLSTGRQGSGQARRCWRRRPHSQNGSSSRYGLLLPCLMLLAFAYEFGKSQKFFPLCIYMAFMYIGAGPV